jgi:hypothetical protein
MPGKKGHTAAAGVGHSGGHAPQNGAKWQEVQTMQRQCQPDRGEKVAPHGTPPDQKNQGGGRLEEPMAKPDDGQPRADPP